jgi:hypothetical protein
MINFFRKTRKKMADDNKPLKYMRYAVGEIALVVIGILIAVQINTWNENRQSHNKLTAYLQGVILDLNDEIKFIEWLIPTYTEYSENHKLLINHPDYNELTRDSLEYRMMTYDKMALRFRDNNFKKIENSGIIEFGSYENVINDITDYYSNWVPYFKYLIKKFNDEVDSEDHYFQIQQNSYEFNSVEGLNSYQTDSQAKKAQIEMLKTPRVRNILKMDYDRNEAYIRTLKQTQDQIDELISKIENVLENKNDQIPLEN